MAELKRKAMVVIAVLSLILGVISTGWMLGAVRQWLIPWKSFAIFLPTSDYWKTGPGE